MDGQISTKFGHTKQHALTTFYLQRSMTSPSRSPDLAINKSRPLSANIGQGLCFVPHYYQYNNYCKYCTNLYRYAPLHSIPLGSIPYYTIPNQTIPLRSVQYQTIPFPAPYEYRVYKASISIYFLFFFFVNELSQVTFYNHLSDSLTSRHGIIYSLLSISTFCL